MYSTNPSGFPSPQAKSQINKAGMTYPDYGWFEDFDLGTSGAENAAAIKTQYFSTTADVTIGKMNGFPNGVIASTSYDSGGSIVDTRILSDPVPYPYPGWSYEFESRLCVNDDAISNSWRDGNPNQSATQIPFALTFGLVFGKGGNLSSAQTTGSSDGVSNNGSLGGGVGFIGFRIRPGRAIDVYATYKSTSTSAATTRHKNTGLLMPVREAEGVSYTQWITLGVVIDGKPAWRGDIPTVEFFVDGQSVAKTIMPAIEFPTSAVNNAQISIQTAHDSAASCGETVLVDYVRFLSDRDPSPNTLHVLANDGRKYGDQTKFHFASSTLGATTKEF